jgi:hypothetical protein
VKPTHTTSELSASTEAADMAAATKVTATSAAKTTTTATVGSCQTGLSQGDRCDANQAK